MGKAYSKFAVSSYRGHFIEVAGNDGILHHVGPFKLLADAQRWIERHVRAHTEDSKPIAAPASTVLYRV